MYLEKLLTVKRSKICDNGKNLAKMYCFKEIQKKEKKERKILVKAGTLSFICS